MRRIVRVLTSVCLAVGWIAAESVDPRRVPRIDAEIVVDGQLDEAAWENALVLELGYEVHPGDNIDARVRTEGLLLYSDTHLFAGFRAHDPDPDRIRARLSDRDRAFQDDFVGVVLDTFNDERRAYEFFVNALGVQMDLIQDDVSGNEDSSWDAIWNSAGRVTSFGYVVEMAIPYTSLRFQRGSGDQVWGLDMLRIYPRDQRYLLASNKRERDVNCYLCQLGKIVGFEGATPGRNLEITPTLTAGRSDQIDSFPDGRLVGGDEEADLGLTVKWGVTPNLTLAGTANPDFSQVEADVAQLDANTQFALFFSEKRPFFLEGADFFETSLAAVYTRTVNDPSVGAKLTGKEGANAIGLFVARDEQTAAGTPILRPGPERSSFGFVNEDVTAGVLRYRRDVGKNSAVGGLVTAREGDTYHSRTAGLDAVLRPTEKDALRLQFLVSQTEDPTDDDPLDATTLGEKEDHALFVSYRHGTRDWAVRVRYSDLGDDFRADLGFIPRVGFRQPIVGGSYTWWLDDNPKWSFLELGGDWDQTELQDGSLQEREIEMFFLGSGPKQFFFFVGPGHRTKVFNGVEFEQDFVNSFFEVQATGDLYLNVDVNLSDREDFRYFNPDPLALPGEPLARQGDEFQIAPGLRFNAGKHLRLDLSHQYSSLDDETGGLFRANLTELRLVYQFSQRMFVRAIAQNLDLRRNLARYPACQPPYDTMGLCNLQPEVRDLFGQFLFSYKLNPQTALFLGYTDQRLQLENTDLVQTGRTFFMKLGYAWVM